MLTGLEVLIEIKSSYLASSFRYSCQIILGFWIKTCFAMTTNNCKVDVPLSFSSAMIIYKNVDGYINMQPSWEQASEEGVFFKH